MAKRGGEAPSPFPSHVLTRHLVAFIRAGQEEDHVVKALIHDCHWPFLKELRRASQGGRLLAGVSKQDSLPLKAVIGMAGEPPFRIEVFAEEDFVLGV